MKPTDTLVDVRRSLHERLIGRVDARQLDATPRAERRLRVREEALSLLREQGHMLPQNALADVVNAVSDAVVGMGPIESPAQGPAGHRCDGERTRRRLRGAEGADREGRVVQAREPSLYVALRTVGFVPDAPAAEPKRPGTPVAERLVGFPVHRGDAVHAIVSAISQPIRSAHTPTPRVRSA